MAGLFRKINSPLSQTSAPSNVTFASNIDQAISPRILCANRILRFVRNLGSEREDTQLDQFVRTKWDQWRARRAEASA